MNQKYFNIFMGVSVMCLFGIQYYTYNKMNALMDDKIKKIYENTSKLNIETRKLINK